MVDLNKNLSFVSKTYLYPKIEQACLDFQKNNPNKKIYNLGVGDISLPLPSSVQEGIINGVKEMGTRPIGYGPPEGYLFLREKIQEVFYQNTPIAIKDIIITDGINGSICAIDTLLEKNHHTVAIMDPAYPLYRDLSTLSGRKIISLPLEEKNHFIPIPPKERVDFVYLCSPMNPTGTAMTRDALRMWVDWAKKHQALIFFDAAYNGFIRSSDVPKTIYEIEGAQDVAIEFCSFSKAFGFTGLRLGYTIIPQSIRGFLQKESVDFQSVWNIDQNIRENGISYPIQKGGYSALQPEGLKAAKEQLDKYLKSASSIKQTLENQGFCCFGGTDCPFVFCKIAGSSWDFFNKLLHEYQILTIPGQGFGKYGEGFVRLSGFLSPKDLPEVLEQLRKIEVITCAMN